MFCMGRGIFPIWRVFFLPCDLYSQSSISVWYLIHHSGFYTFSCRVPRSTQTVPVLLKEWAWTLLSRSSELVPGVLLACASVWMGLGGGTQGAVLTGGHALAKAWIPSWVCLGATGPHGSSGRAASGPQTHLWPCSVEPCRCSLEGWPLLCCLTGCGSVTGEFLVIAEFCTIIPERGWECASRCLCEQGDNLLAWSLKTPLILCPQLKTVFSRTDRFSFMCKFWMVQNYHLQSPAVSCSSYTYCGLLHSPFLTASLFVFRVKLSIS